MVNKKGDGNGNGKCKSYPIRSNLLPESGKKPEKRTLPKPIHDNFQKIFGQLKGQKEVNIFIQTLLDGDFGRLGYRINGRKKVPLWVFPQLRANAKRLANGKPVLPIIPKKKKKEKISIRKNIPIDYSFTIDSGSFI